MTRGKDECAGRCNLARQEPPEPVPPSGDERAVQDEVTRREWGAYRLVAAAAGTKGESRKGDPPMKRANRSSCFAPSSWVSKDERAASRPQYVPPPSSGAAVCSLGCAGVFYSSLKGHVNVRIASRNHSPVVSTSRATCESRSRIRAGRLI